MVIKFIIRYLFTLSKIAIIKQNGKQQVLGYRETGTLVHSWRERRMVLLLWQTV